MGEIRTVDARGDQCPIPVVKAKKVLDIAAAGDVVEVHVDNEIAVQNLTKLAKNRQCGCSAEKVADKHFVVKIEAAAAVENAGAPNAGTENAGAGDGAGAAQAEGAVCYPDARDRSIVVVSSATMGVGNDELGTVLMKGFLYALGQLDTLPEKILFYNGGVTLTTEGSDSLEDLKAMEAQGVEIYSCGTCLNYYGLSDKLCVGEVTNMYNIVEAMAGASKIIRP